MQTNQPIPADELHGALSEAHCDLYKEVHGIRPRWMNYEVMTVGQVERELLNLHAEVEATIAWNASQARDAVRAAIREEERTLRERWMDQAQAFGCHGW